MPLQATEMNDKLVPKNYITVHTIINVGKIQKSMHPHQSESGGFTTALGKVGRTPQDQTPKFYPRSFF